MMTFRKFQADREWCTDLGKALDDNCWEEDQEPARGWLYCGCLYIEEVQPWWPASARGQGRWCLTIGNQGYITSDLESLEQKLYTFAESEGYLDD